MIAAIATPRRRSRKPPHRRQLGLPFRAEQPTRDPPPPPSDGPEPIGSILQRLLEARGLTGPRARFRR